MRNRIVTLCILVAIVAIVGGSLAIAGGSEFGGTDGAASDAIVAAEPDYEPWFSAIWAPGSAEVESGLFALQAALGAGLLGFGLGTLRERRRSSARR